MDFDPFDDRPSRKPLTQRQRTEEQFVETCSELVYEWNPVDDLVLQDAVLQPLHRYLTEATMLLQAIQHSTTLSDRQHAIRLLAQLCGHFAKRKGFGRPAFTWLEVVTEQLWYATNPTMDPFERKPSFWTTDDADTWEQFLPWVKRLPWLPISPMDAETGLAKFYDAEKAEWLVEINGPDSATYRLDRIRAWSNACELFDTMAESQFQFDHWVLNTSETLSKFLQAEAMIHKVLTFADLQEREADQERNAVFNTPAGSRDEAERRARQLIAADPGFADRMTLREWMEKIRCGASMVKRLKSWQAIEKRKANQNGLSVALHDGHADPHATSPAHDDALAKLIDQQQSEQAEQALRHVNAPKRNSRVTLTED